MRNEMFWLTLDWIDAEVTLHEENFHFPKELKVYRGVQQTLMD